MYQHINYSYFKILIWQFQLPGPANLFPLIALSLDCFLLVLFGNYNFFYCMPNIVCTRTVQKTEVNYIFTCSLACLFCLVFNVWCCVCIVRGWAVFGPYCFTAAVCVAKASAFSECRCFSLVLTGLGVLGGFHQCFWYSLHLHLSLRFCAAEDASGLLPLQQGWRAAVWSSAQGLWWREGSCADLLLNLSEGLPAPPSCTVYICLVFTLDKDPHPTSSAWCWSWVPGPTWFPVFPQ